MIVITHTHLLLYPEVWVTRIQSVSNELVLREDQLKIAPEVKMKHTTISRSSNFLLSLKNNHKILVFSTVPIVEAEWQ